MTDKPEVVMIRSEKMTCIGCIYATSGVRGCDMPEGFPMCVQNGVSYIYVIKEEKP